MYRDQTYGLPGEGEGSGWTKVWLYSTIGSVSFLTRQSYDICKCLIFGYFEVQWVNCKRYSSTQHVLNSFVILGLKYWISPFQNQSPIEKKNCHFSDFHYWRNVSFVVQIDFMYICLGGWIPGVFSQRREHRLGCVSQWGALVQSWARPGNFQPIGSLVTPFGACQPMGSSGT